MLIWVAVSADTTAETTPTTRGSSKLGFTRNLASVSRMVRPPAPLAISQAYDLDTKLVRTRHLPVRTIRQPRKRSRLRTGQPGVHRLPRHRPLARDLRHRKPVGQNREHRLTPLLNHRNLPHGEGVSRVGRKPNCQGISRTTTCLESRRGELNP